LSLQSLPASQTNLSHSQEETNECMVLCTVHGVSKISKM
jgi:hypothetical protein